MKGPKNKVRTQSTDSKRHAPAGTGTRPTEASDQQQISGSTENDGVVDGLIANPIVNEQEQDQVTNQQEQATTETQENVTNRQDDLKDIY